MPIEKDVLTTGEVAKICNVAPRTVSKWFDSGSLRGYRIPGSKDRRIPVSELIKFMRAHGIPMDGITSGRTRVLIVDDETEITAVLHKVLTEQTNYEVKVAPSAFEAGMECERFKPHVVLLDIHLGDGATGDARAVAKIVRDNDSLQMTRIVAMSAKLTDGQAQGLKAMGFDSFLKKPFQVRQVVEAIEAPTNLVPQEKPAQPNGPTRPPNSGAALSWASIGCFHASGAIRPNHGRPRGGPDRVAAPCGLLYLQRSSAVRPRRFACHREPRHVQRPPRRPRSPHPRRRSPDPPAAGGRDP